MLYNINLIGCENMEQLIEVNISASPTLDYCNLNSKRLNHPMIKRFVEDLNRDRKKDMTFFYNNLEALRIKRINKAKGICYDAAAQYCMNNNIIEVICSDRIDTYIDHELLHMASTILDEDGNVYSGFIQLKGQLGIGYGIDEGFTAVLDDRYFMHRTAEKEKINNNTYCVVKYLAKMVEEFVGKEKMEDLYFEANLLGLVKILAKYTSIEAATQFIHNIDMILIKFEQARFRDYFFCLKKFSECMLFMAEAWYARVTELYMDGKINDEEYEACIVDIKKILHTQIELQHFPIKSVKLDDYYPKVKNKVDIKLVKKYKRKDTTITN